MAKNKNLLTLTLLFILIAGGGLLYYFKDDLFALTIVGGTQAFDAVPNQEVYSNTLSANNLIDSSYYIGTRSHSYGFANELGKIMLVSNLYIPSYTRAFNTFVTYKISCLVQGSDVVLDEFTHNVDYLSTFQTFDETRTFFIEDISDSCYPYTAKLEVYLQRPGVSSQVSIDYSFVSIPKTFNAEIAEQSIATAKTLTCDNNYLYCSYVTSDCSSLLVVNTDKTYSCADNECTGFFTNTNNPTIVCNIPTSGGNPTAKINIHSQDPIITCDNTQCVTGATRCNIEGFIEECKDLDNSNDGCGEQFQATDVCTGSLTCSNGECVCPEDQCVLGQSICSGNGVQTCVENSQGCNEWSSIQACDTDQICSGGVCSCESASCNLGSTQCSGTTQYKTCGVYDGSCPDLSNAINCPEDKVCQVGSCVCPDTGTNIGAQRCAGSGYQVYDVYNNDNCPSWGNVQNCPSGQSCNDGVCGCPDTGNNVGDTQCVDSTSYQTWQVNSGLCPTWSSTVECPTGQTCSSGECSCPVTSNALGDTRCVSGGYQVWSVYSGTCPSWGNTISCGAGQSCSIVNGDAICACPSSSCTLGDSRCVNNAVQECVVSATGCTEYQEVQQCGTAEVCEVHSPAACYPLFGDIVITSEPEYEFNQPIPISIEVTSTSNLDGVRVYFTLTGDGNTLESSFPAVFLVNNQATYTFQPVTQSYNTFTVRVRLEKDNAIVSESKEINIKSGLTLTLSNTPPNYVNEKTTLNIIVTPSAAEYFLQGVSILSPNGINIAPSLVNSQRIEFTPTVLGTHTVSATASASGFVSSPKQIIINVQSKTLTIQYLLDGEDINSYSNGFINPGQHELVIKSVESGNVPVDLDNINLQLIPPSGVGSAVPLIFSDLTTGEQRAEINTPLPGREYSITGVLQKFGSGAIEDTNIQVNLPLKTIGSGGSSSGGGTGTGDVPIIDSGILLWVSIGGGIFLLGVILIIVFRKRK